MAQRTVRVGPDTVMQTRDGRQVGIVSRDRQFAALCDLATVCDVAGGTISVLYGRTSTGVEGEMATTELLLHWRDRTDAKPQYEESVAFERGLVLIDDEPITEVADEFLAEVDHDEPFVADGVVSHAEELAASAVE